MVKPNPKLLNVAERMREDSQRGNQLMEWLRDSDMAKAGVVVAAIAASLGLGGMIESMGESNHKQQPIENTKSIIPEAEPLVVETPVAEPVAEPETTLEDYEREAMEAEARYQEIIEGKNVRGNAGTDWVQHATPGEGAPQMTEDDYQKIYEAKSKVGTGMSMEEMDELGDALRQRAGMSQEHYEQLQQRVRDRVNNEQAAKKVQKMTTGKRTISWEEAVARSGYEK